MILLDTNVIIDLLGASSNDPSLWSSRCYDAIDPGRPLASNHVVLAEIAAGSEQHDHILEDLDRLHIEIMPLTTEAAFAAGKAHRAYRRRGGARAAILADFLIAGHAESLGATLMTRDRRLATYFPDLPLITPETHP